MENLTIAASTQVLSARPLTPRKAANVEAIRKPATVCTRRTSCNVSASAQTTAVAQCARTEPTSTASAARRPSQLRDAVKRASLVCTPPQQPLSSSTAHSRRDSLRQASESVTRDGNVSVGSVGRWSDPPREKQKRGTAGHDVDSSVLELQLRAQEEAGIDTDEASDSGGEEEDQAEPISAAQQQQQDDKERCFRDKLAVDEPARKAPAVEVRSLMTPYVWLSVTPFSHRLHTIAFLPCDSPWEGDPQQGVPQAYVTPCSLDPLTNVTGQRKRIGRKNKFGDLLYSLPEGSVRFSSVLAIFGNAGFREADEGDDSDSSDAKRWSVRWTKRVEPEEYKALLPLQKVNHFPGTWGIGRKDNLHRHLTKYMHQHGSETYNFHPEAWILPQDAVALSRDMQAREHCPSGMDRNLYIVKQVASACGRRMRLLCNGGVPKGKWLVQRYVHDPLLIYGYKFDLRLYVVVTSYLPLKVYVYEEGLVRFATTPYPVPDPNSAKRRNMRVKSITAHLTNYSVNKNNTEAFVNPADDGEDDESGSKWVLTTVKRYFEKKGLSWENSWKRIEDLIVKTLLSVEQDVVQQMRSNFGVRPSGYTNCFELYGFDVLFRENLDPVLMEVNIMPSLSTKCSLLDQRVKANMIADMLTLVGAYSLEKKPKTSPTGAPAVPPSVVKLHPFFANLSVHELECIFQSEEENLRRCHFKRLFPTATAHDTYRSLFVEVKPLNALLCQWEKEKVLNPPSWYAEQQSHGANRRDVKEDALDTSD